MEEGELLSLLGPSGCGKSTTLKIIAGLLQPDRGEIFLGDSLVNAVPIEQRGAVIVFQDHLLFPHLTVAENIGFGLKMAKQPKSHIDRKVREMLALVEMEGYEQRYPAKLSGGQQQRVAVARALAIEPKVLLLDEPFSNLDARLKENVRALTIRLLRQLGITTVLVTHEKQEALMYSQRVAVMLEGRIVQCASPEELYRAPASLAAALFLGDGSQIPGKVKAGQFTGAFLSCPAPLGDTEQAIALIRPEDVRLAPQGSHQGIITARKFAGDRVYYTLRVGELELQAAAPSNLSLKPGSATGFSLRREHLLFYDQAKGEQRHA